MGYKLTTNNITLDLMGMAMCRTI